MSTTTTSNNPFVAGDEVRCIEPLHGSALQHGRVYKVEEAGDSFVRLGDLPGKAWSYLRFELAKRELKAGDRVKCIDNADAVKLYIGHIYVVDEVVGLGVSLVGYPGPRWYGARFELVERPRFGVGDKVTRDQISEVPVGSTFSVEFANVKSGEDGVLELGSATLDHSWLEYADSITLTSIPDAKEELRVARAIFDADDCTERWDQKRYMRLARRAIAALKEGSE